LIKKVLPIVQANFIFEKVISEGAFLEWMRRLEKWISRNGEYVGGDEQNAKRGKWFSQ
jgi:hypothetical protein